MQNAAQNLGSRAPRDTHPSAHSIRAVTQQPPAQHELAAPRGPAPPASSAAAGIASSDRAPSVIEMSTNCPVPDRSAANTPKAAISAPPATSAICADACTGGPSRVTPDNASTPARAR